MTGPTFGDAQLKLWLRRVQTELSKGTPPEATLDLVKATMNAQAAGETQLLPTETVSQRSAKTS